ncbi:MAG: D-aminoacylase [Sulfolobales archaeon]
MRFDLIIKGGIVVDGSGSPPFRADIGVVGDEIRAIKDLSGASAERVIDARDLYVAPGFIDIHNHSDLSVIEIPTADNYVLQGVTTIVIGNCGSSPAPLSDVNREDYVKSVKREYPEVEIRWGGFGEYLDVLEKAKPSINVAPLVGHGTIRSSVLGFEDRKPSERDLEMMKERVEEAMKAGAFGMSTGLIYVPSMFADTREIIELARVVARYGGIYATHMRNEGVRLVDSVIEAITIGVEAGIGVEISHLKASGRPAWGKVGIALELITEYASKGYDISADAYPYTASATSLTAILPKHIREGSREEVLKKLSDPRVLDELRESLGGVALEERYLSWSDIMISYSPSRREFEGLRIDRIAEKLGVDPVEAVVRLLIEDQLATGMILFGMREEDVERVISHPLVAIGSDSSIRRFGEGKPHPRGYGTFPRVIARYVREKKLITLEEAVRKMTLLPARKLRLWDRGLIRPGFKADLVIFDYYRIEDTATYENPHSYPRGVRYVVVNGGVVVENSVLNKSVRSGRVLRRYLYV